MNRIKVARDNAELISGGFGLVHFRVAAGKKISVGDLFTVSPGDVSYRVVEVGNVSTDRLGFRKTTGTALAVEIKESSRQETAIVK